MYMTTINLGAITVWLLDKSKSRLGGRDVTYVESRSMSLDVKVLFGNLIQSVHPLFHLEPKYFGWRVLV